MIAILLKSINLLSQSWISCGPQRQLRRVLFVYAIVIHWKFHPTSLSRFEIACSKQRILGPIHWTFANSSRRRSVRHWIHRVESFFITLIRTLWYWLGVVIGIDSDTSLPPKHYKLLSDASCWETDVFPVSRFKHFLHTVATRPSSIRSYWAETRASRKQQRVRRTYCDVILTEAHRNAGNFRESKYFQNPNPGMIFSRVESLCTTHSNLKNIQSRTQKAWQFSQGKQILAPKTCFPRQPSFMFMIVIYFL
jgi:hypothetical protein